MKRADAPSTDPARGYLLRNLPYHLARAARWPELHELLAESAQRPRWAGDRLAADGSYAGYLEDLQLVWDWADWDLGSNAEAAGRQVRYALISAAIRGLAGNVPAALLEALLAHDVWTPQQALQYTRQIADPRQAARNLAVVARYVPPSLFDEARGLAHQIPSAAERAPVLVGLVAAASPEQHLRTVGEALAALADLQDTYSFTAALRTLLPFLLPADYTSLLDCVAGRSDAGEQTEALAAIFARLPAALLSRAQALLETAILHQPTASGAAGLAALAPRLAAHAQNDAWQRAISMAAGLADAGEAGDCLAALVPALPVVLIPNVVPHALALRTPLGRTRVIASLLPRVDDATRARLLSAGLQAVKQLPGGTDPVAVRQLAAFLPALPATEAAAVSQAVLEQIHANDWSTARVIGLALLLPYVSGDLHTALTAEALEAIGQPDNDYRRAEAMAELAPVLPENDRTHLLDLALAIKDASDRCRALAGLAPHLPPAQQPALLDAAGRIDDEAIRLRLIESLAPYLAPDLLPRAVDVAQAMRDGDMALRAMAALAREVPATRFCIPPAHLLDRLMTIADAELRAGVLSSMVPWLPAAQQDQAWQALVSSLAVCPSARLRYLLAPVAASMPPVVVDAALGMIDGLWSVVDREAALVALAAVLPDDRLEWLLETLPTLQDAAQRAAAAAAVRPRLAAERGEALLRPLIDKACGGRAGECRDFLEGLAPALSPGLLDYAQACVRKIPDPDIRAEASLALLHAVSPAEEEGLLQAVVQAVRTSGDWQRRLRLINDLAAQGRLTAALAESLLPAVREIGDDGTVARGLAALLPALPPGRQAGLVGEAMDHCLRTVHPLDRAEICLALGPWREMLPGWDGTFWRAYQGLYQPQVPQVLLGLLPFVPAAEHAGYLVQVLRDGTMSTQGIWAQDWPRFLAAWRSVTPQDRRRVWTEGLRTLSGQPRPDLLRNLVYMAPMVAKMGAESAVCEAARAIVDVQAWWP